METFLDEEVFIAQLSLRARLLNIEFQQAVLRVLQNRASVSPSMYECAPKLESERSTKINCRFLDSEHEIVEVHFAPPKTGARMREKLKKYCYPHPKAVWPLCANIVDPVRISIVCKGSSQIVQVLAWFTEHEKETGLKVCRIKNKFAFHENQVADGYRDLKLFVLFEGMSGLKIIGEIQIHDKVLHILKLKVWSNHINFCVYLKDFSETHFCRCTSFIP